MAALGQTPERQPDGWGNVAASLRVRAHGLPEDVIARIHDAGATTETMFGVPDAVLVSTRAPREAREVLDDHQGLAPVVVLAHAGGERVAADLVRTGAWAILGEGNEAALWALIDEQRAPATLVASYERRFGTERRTPGHGVDAPTGLPDIRELEARLGAIAESGRLPTTAHVRIAAERWHDDPADVVVSVQRRRLASAIAHECAAFGAELFATGDSDFTVLSERLDARRVEELGHRIVDAGATFRDRGLPLRVVVGYALAEREATVEELLDRARRASEIALSDGQQAVLASSLLERWVSETTELETVMRLIDDVEASVPEGRGHSERVARMMAEFARMLGVASTEVVRWQLAGHLHDVGQAGLPLGAIASSSTGPGSRESWEQFPVRGAQMLRVATGSDITDIIAAQREQFDGGGFPGQLVGEAIPFGARALAVVHLIDEVMSASSRDDLETALRREAGARLDPTMVNVALQRLPAILGARS